MSTLIIESVDEYLRHLEELYKQIQEWLHGEGLAWEEQKVVVNEERSGPYKASLLIIRQSDGEQMAKLKPIGAHIIGAKGRVDLSGALDSQPFLYLLTAGPTVEMSISTEPGGELEEHAPPLFRGIDREGWYALADREPKSVQRVNRETFLDLLEKVADCEPK